MADSRPGNGNVETLKRWAVAGAGAVHFAWGTPGDFARCQAFYKDKMPDHMIDGWCSNLHKLATGARPGHAPAEETSREAKH